MNENHKIMLFGFVLILIFGIGISYYIIQDAEGSDEVCTYIQCKIMEATLHILDELREQTYLDQQRNCLIAHGSQTHFYGNNKYDLHALEKVCGPIYGNTLKWG